MHLGVQWPMKKVELSSAQVLSKGMGQVSLSLLDFGPKGSLSLETTAACS